MDAKQFAWFYLVENGMAGVEKEFYGGYNIIDKRFAKENTWETITHNKIKTLYLHEIKTYGVNWEKTSAPSSTTISEFQGTFSEASESEYLEGNLILKNDNKQQWIAEALEVTNVFEIMANIEGAKEKFKTLFGG